MRTRNFPPFILILSVALAPTTWASGPFQATCASEQNAALETLSALRMCLEKAGSKKQTKQTSEVCATPKGAHERAIGSLKECLASSSTKPEEARP